MFKEPANSLWQEDGIEGDVQCWRLEVAPDVQFKLFAVSDDHEKLRPEYHSPRIFVGKMNLDLHDEYLATQSFEVTDREAVALLSLDAERIREIMGDLIEELNGTINR